MEPQDPTEKYGLDADEADYGESLWRGTEKVAQKHASEVEQRLNERLEEVQRELETARHQSFLDDLRKRIPNFDAFNEDARFLGWLDQPDSLRGVMRQQLLDEAVTARDAARVAAVFEAFLTNSGVRSQSAPTSLAAQVVPPASGSLTANTSGKPIYSLAQWEAAMDQAARLQTSKPQRAQQLIQELDLALREGRVRYPQQRAAPG